MRVRCPPTAFPAAHPPRTETSARPVSKSSSKEDYTIARPSKRGLHIGRGAARTIRSKPVTQCPSRVNRYRSFAAEPDAKSALTQNRPNSNPVAACLHFRRPSCFSSDRISLHSSWCSSRAAAYQRLLNSSSTAQPTFLPRDLSLSRRSRWVVRSAGGSLDTNSIDRPYMRIRAAK